MILKLINKVYSIILQLEYKALQSRYIAIDRTARFGVAYSGRIKILHPHNLNVGKYTVINPDSLLDCAGGIKIGAYCHFGRGLTIYSSNHNFRSDQYIPYGLSDIIRPVIIEDFVWIGANVSICPGVTIGEGAVIGMGSVVTKDVEPMNISAGNPAKEIGMRNVSEFHKLKAAEKFQ